MRRSLVPTADAQPPPDDSFLFFPLFHIMFEREGLQEMSVL